MPKRISWLIGSLFCAILFTAGTVKANTVELITNGSFESNLGTSTLLGTPDAFTGWTQAQNGGAFYFVEDGSTGPVVPTDGTYYAMSDQGSPSQMVLFQDFTVPVGATSVTLSFDMFADNFANATNCGTGAGALDPASGTFQCARVDILSASAIALDNYDTGSGVLQNVYNNADLGTSLPFSPYTADLTGLGPGNYALRFATVVTQAPLLQGIDNVSIVATTSVPEPSTLVLLGVGLFGLALAGSLKRKAVCSSSISA